MIIEKLNLNLIDPFTLTLGGNSAVGKSTAMAIMASELINNGYSIAYITEESTRIIFKRLKNLVYVKNGKARIFKAIDGEVDIQETINLGNFDFVFCDVHLKDKKKVFDKINEVRLKQKISFFVSTQIKHKVNTSNYLESIPSVQMRMSNYVVTLSKREPNFFDKIKKFFGFPIKNRTFALIKNRIGDRVTFNHLINFEQINKN